MRRLDRDGLSAWYSDLATRPTPSIDGIRLHDRVVQAALTETVTPLPARFGQWFPDVGTLAARMAASSAAYGRALGTVARAAEFSVVVLPGGDTAPKRRPRATPSTQGRVYLHGLARRRAADEGAELGAERVLDELDDAVGPLAAETRRLPPGGGGHVLARAVHLVHHENARAYSSVVAQFRDGRPGIRLLLTGPSAPYSFTP